MFPSDDNALDAEPFAMFARWLAEAQASAVPDFNAMTLATVNGEGRPSARIVLLRGCDEHGFVFFTNYASRKGADLAANPAAALVLFWQPLGRQVRIEGEVARVSAAESDAYFAARPWGHQLSAVISPQSQPIPDRAFLERRLQELHARLGEARSIPRPACWGGYRLVPSMIEFWQNRENRLHDRIRYLRGPSGWRRERLAP